jgi:hypothetical protein
MVRAVTGGEGARVLPPSDGSFNQMLPRGRGEGRLPDEPRSALVSAGRNL